MLHYIITIQKFQYKINLTLNLSRIKSLDSVLVTLFFALEEIL